MLDRETREKVLRIMELSLIKTTENKNTIFVSFSGHCNSLDIQIYKNGWNVKKNVSFGKLWFFDNHTTKENIKTLNEIIEILENLEGK